MRARPIGSGSCFAVVVLLILAKSPVALQFHSPTLRLRGSGHHHTPPSTKTAESDVQSSKRVQLHRGLSKLGLCSRAVAQNVIKAGRVSVNGKKVMNMLTWVDIQNDKITVDEGDLHPQSCRMWAMNKPRGLVTARRDDRGRRTVFSLFPKEVAMSGQLKGPVPTHGPRDSQSLKRDCQSARRPAWRFPVGRLDADSEGLLLFCTDGPLAEALTQPNSGLAKIYRVWVRGRATRAGLERLSCGVNLDGKPTLPAIFTLIRNGTSAEQTAGTRRGQRERSASSESHLDEAWEQKQCEEESEGGAGDGLGLEGESAVHPRRRRRRVAPRGGEGGGSHALRAGDRGVTGGLQDAGEGCSVVEVLLHEGRHRQIRRMLGMEGLRVVRLQRVRHGPVCLAGLQPGTVRELSAAEVRAVQEEVATRGRGQASGSSKTM